MWAIQVGRNLLAVDDLSHECYNYTLLYNSCYEPVILFSMILGAVSPKGVFRLAYIHSTLVHVYEHILFVE